MACDTLVRVSRDEIREREVEGIRVAVFARRYADERSAITRTGSRLGEFRLGG